MTFREQIPDVPTLLAEVRRRPGIWIGKKSIERLHMMLSGIDFAEDWHGIPPGERFGGFDFAAFESWVEQAHNPERLSAFSFGLAPFLAGSDAEGFDLWFRWYDEFLQTSGDRTKFRLAINGFVLAYGREFRTTIEYWPRKDSDHFGIRVCDDDGQLTTSRDCPTLERALQLGERFFDTPRRDWTLAPETIEPWRDPAAKEFEERRLVVRDQLRALLAGELS